VKAAEPNALQKILADHTTRTGESLSALAGRCGLPRQTVLAIARRTDWKEPPREATMAKLAEGLSIPIAELRKAALSVLGYTTVVENLGPDQWAVTHIMGEVSDDRRAAIRAVAEALLAEQTAHGGAASSRGRAAPKAV
jgi:hypothetical protein